MGKAKANTLLIAGLVLPIVIFMLLLSSLHSNVLIAAVLAVAIGWALNIAWSFAARGHTGKDGSQSNENFPRIAMRFGWACPVVLVLLTWLVWKFLLNHAG